MRNLETIKTIIKDSWPGEIELGEEYNDYGTISYSTFSAMFIDKLFLSMDSGRISIGRQFWYDEERSEDVDQELYFWERAFIEYLSRHSDIEVSCWHDLCYDLGYPGTDYVEYVGFENLECTEKIIKEYLYYCDLFSEKIRTLQDAIHYLLKIHFPVFGKEHGISIRDKSATEKTKIKNIEESIETIHYYCCKIDDVNYICNLQRYKEAEKFFSNNNLDYTLYCCQRKLVFDTTLISIEIELIIPEDYLIEAELRLLLLKQKREAASLKCFLDNSCNLLLEERESENNKELTKKLIRICSRMLQNVLYHDATEDNRNDYLRDLLDDSRFFTKDQTRTGFSATEKSAGECDIVVYCGQDLLSFIECENLENVNEKYITDHLRRLLNYDRTGVLVNYLISYVKVKNVSNFKRKYHACIVNKSKDYPYELLSFEEIDSSVYIKGGVTNIYIFKMSINREDKVRYIYHILTFFKCNT